MDSFTSTVLKLNRLPSSVPLADDVKKLQNFVNFIFLKEGNPVSTDDNYTYKRSRPIIIDL
jgi:hypothetical protein